MYNILDGMCSFEIFEVIGTPHCRCGGVFVKTHPLIVKLSGLLAEGAMYTGFDWAKILPAGQVEVEDDDDACEDETDGKGAAAMFAAELQRWHQQDFESKQAFNEAVVQLNNSTDYSVSINHTRPPNANGFGNRRYTCNTKGCTVSCSVSYHQDGGKAAVAVHNALHSHPPGGRRRMRRDEKRIIQEAMGRQVSVGRGNKRTLAASTKARLIIHEETGHAFSGNEVSRAMRGDEKKRRLELIQKAAAGVEAVIDIGRGEGEVCAGDGISSTVKATLNILRSLMWADRGAYVRVAHDNHRIQYIYFCTGRQRTMGYRFGLRFLDDKHGSSSQQYHLAACVVINGEGKLEIAAIGYLGSSSCALWNEFISDCRVAFEGEEGSTLRDRVAAVDRFLGLAPLLALGVLIGVLGSLRVCVFASSVGVLPLLLRPLLTLAFFLT
eukprot:GHVU01148581.1.p1 GENE.GHVU01148581.1~~GHVU01148581.1.p1  ORF type:complete len:438 (-),score=32.05 GHVU01148581.1:413-1726(-)